MPIYAFDFDEGPNPVKFTDQRFDPKDRDGELEKRPVVQTPPPALTDAKPRTTLWFENTNVNTAEEVHEILPQGFRTMDRGIKNYFSGIQVPTKDGIRMMQVRISGGDKPYLVWAQDLRRGRVQLPVMSIKRESEDQYNPKFSPAHMHYMTRRFVDTEGSRTALVFRPVSSLLRYSLAVWAEHKRDLEYIEYQIRSKFNPVAEFFVEDEHLRGSVFMKFEGMTTSIDDELPADQLANKRYNYTITMEGWLPLPEKIVPTILGRVTSFKEGEGIVAARGEVLEPVQGKLNLASTHVRI